jgi:hypothetical protein
MKDIELVKGLNPTAAREAGLASRNFRESWFESAHRPSQASPVLSVLVSSPLFSFGGVLYQESIYNMFNRRAGLTPKECGRDHV